MAARRARRRSPVERRPAAPLAVGHARTSGKARRRSRTTSFMERRPRDSPLLTNTRSGRRRKMCTAHRSPLNTVRHPVGRRSVGAGRRGSATPRSPWRSPNDVAAPTAGVDDVDDREWPRPPRHASKYANSFRPGGGDYIGKTWRVRRRDRLRRRAPPPPPPVRRRRTMENDAHRRSHRGRRGRRGRRRRRRSRGRGGRSTIRGGRTPGRANRLLSSFSSPAYQLLKLASPWSLR